MAVGVRGRRAIVPIIVIARGIVACEDWNRQGVVLDRLFGEIVSVMA